MLPPGFSYILGIARQGQWPAGPPRFASRLVTFGPHHPGED
jgi:hypothetical protein